ncbi:MULTISPECIES: DUF2268 domain-containing protein [unclassified Bacillus (in: firmicutes)]|uniref:DUF2268 domain-containing protein n=1 Tax=unclassified Bacillus (in: firmicutes) TaxID=185979 RepID=UPI0008F0C93E|nr:MULTISPECIES: DUF2268 domain-containing protein [unclassified Bacillus (in: firmicutes)]SFA78725.1 Uncharacterized protein YjaZ [Bacillus sp. UNCCL13]SFQ68648.1 Uncharacterized protein YjaZ [Bacillus sp. cl95]
MGIINTNDWLKENFYDPLKVCTKLKPLFPELNEKEIYTYMKKFHMYTPSRNTKTIYQQLKASKVWETVETLYIKYKKIWNGPDVPVYIFPLDGGNRLFVRNSQNKCGVSFQDKMFLFLGDIKDEKEIEAVFVHEYHHVCRLNELNKNLTEYSLLDSIVMEGLAEKAVEHHCGKVYLADWCRKYSHTDIEKWWGQYMIPNLCRKKNERIHDHILYGVGRYPSMLGYSIGYHIVEEFYDKKNFSAKASFSISPEELLKEIKFQ